MTNINMWPRSTRSPIEPPEITLMPGRPGKNRKKAKNEAFKKKFEKAIRKGRKMTCSVRKCIGHNKKGCPTLKKYFSSSCGSQPTVQTSTSTAAAAVERDTNASTAEEMPINAKSSSGRFAGRPSNSDNAPRCSGRPANAHSAPTTTGRPANTTSVGGVRPAAAVMPTTTSAVGATNTQSTTQQSTSGVGAQNRKPSTALRGSANLTYKRPRQKKAKEAGFGVLFRPSGSVVEKSENTERVLHSPTLISSVTTNIDLGFKPNGLRWKVAESPSRFFEWNVTYGTISPLGVPQQGILINGQFPGPDIISFTNDMVFVNVFNNLDEPFLISWSGVQHRKNSFVDGVWGTTCPIPPGKNFTYTMQMKDQIGSFYYFPSLGFHKAAGGFGSIRIFTRPSVPFPVPAYSDDFIVLIGDWYKCNHTKLRAILDRGHKLPFPDGILINGRGPNGATFTVDQGNTYRLRISNVGLEHSLNFRIEGHNMTLVEVEGTHTIQVSYSSLDVHVGQSYSVLITADQAPKDYYIVVSSRFTFKKVLTTTGVLHYSNSNSPVSGPIPNGPTIEVGWSLHQARSIRTNLTANGPRPNPQGSYHYGMINTTRTIRLGSSAAQVNGKQRYAVNSLSFVPTDNTPLKLADYFKIGGFTPGNIPDAPPGGRVHLDTSVLQTDYKAFIEIIFENKERIVQSWHIDGYAFWVVGMDGGRWTPESRNLYNLRDAVSRSTTQVYPRSWTAIYIALDNAGMWNIRSEFWARQYLGQQLYMRVYTTSTSLQDEYRIPANALLCGKVSDPQNKTVLS
ncbi:L-ascorbate oxidase -like protein [Capsicum baccatum]|uniref:L-ascorbate oxidase-like protein n=1 Tax=Capsicum baccatum TaxID=33114 RepID=A0A2G2VIC9_CAPBA|nr:L-ascorbate oxidase -like protein [Capsicum baccatum]